MIKIILVILFSIFIANAYEEKKPTNKSFLDLKNRQTSPSINSNSGCVVPSASPSGPLPTDLGVIGGPKEERNNPHSYVYPAPGCKINLNPK